MPARRGRLAARRAQEHTREVEKPSGKLPLEAPEEVADRSAGTPPAPRLPGVGGYRTKWAVVIGIDRYDVPGGGLKPRECRRGHARALLATLRDEYGFTTSEEGTAIGGVVDDKRIREVLAAWPPSDQVGERDVVVFFYAGHGGEQGEMIGSNGRSVMRGDLLDSDAPLEVPPPSPDPGQLLRGECVPVQTLRCRAAPQGGASSPIVASAKSGSTANAAPSGGGSSYDIFTDYLRDDASFAPTGEA